MNTNLIEGTCLDSMVKARHQSSASFQHPPLTRPLTARQEASSTAAKPGFCQTQLSQSFCVLMLLDRVMCVTLNDTSTTGAFSGTTGAHCSLGGGSPATAAVGRSLGGTIVVVKPRLHCIYMCSLGQGKGPTQTPRKQQGLKQ